MKEKPKESNINSKIIRKRIIMPGFNFYYNATPAIKSKQGSLICDSIRGEGYLINRFTQDKFIHDKAFIENEKCILVIEGVILNKKDLSSGKYPWEEVIWDLYIKNGDTFFERFRGSFSGLLYDKKSDKWIVFTDHIGSKFMHYYANGDTLVISSEIKDLYDYLKHNDIKYQLNEDAAYMLLSYAYMLGDKTLCTEIKKLLPGHYIIIQNSKLSVKEYYKLPLSATDGKPDENILIEELDKKFRKAVQSQFEKDKEYGYQHFVSLSGGLDSRMVTWVAHAMGYTDQINFTFSQSDYLDETIAKKIAADLKHEWIFKSLDNGLFLKDIDEVNTISGGDILYYGVAHNNSMLKLINFSRLGIIHTGVLGDVIIGSYIKRLNKDDLKYSGGAALAKYLHKPTPFLQEFPDFSHLESAMLYQRGFNMINTGVLLLQQYAETLSPFYDIDFFEFCLSIPISLRMNHRLYFKWIVKKYPEAAHYIWESTKSRIDGRIMVNAKGSRVPISRIPLLALYKLGILKRGLASRNHMNPLDYWYNTNWGIREFQDQYFKDNINRITRDELKSDCIKLYHQGTAAEKNQVLTLLSALKLFF